jgi:hypothetical protein
MFQLTASFPKDPFLDGYSEGASPSAVSQEVLSIYLRQLATRATDSHSTAEYLHASITAVRLKILSNAHRAMYSTYTKEFYLMKRMLLQMVATRNEHSPFPLKGTSKGRMGEENSVQRDLMHDLQPASNVKKPGPLPKGDKGSANSPSTSNSSTVPSPTEEIKAIENEMAQEANNESTSTSPALNQLEMSKLSHQIKALISGNDQIMIVTPPHSTPSTPSKSSTPKVLPTHPSPSPILAKQLTQDSSNVYIEHDSWPSSHVSTVSNHLVTNSPNSNVPTYQTAREQPVIAAHASNVNSQSLPSGFNFAVNMPTHLILTPYGYVPADALPPAPLTSATRPSKTGTSASGRISNSFNKEDSDASSEKEDTNNVMDQDRQTRKERMYRKKKSRRRLRSHSASQISETSAAHQGTHHVSMDGVSTTEVAINELRASSELPSSSRQKRQITSPVNDPHSHSSYINAESQSNLLTFSPTSPRSVSPVHGPRPHIFSHTSPSAQLPMGAIAAKAASNSVPSNAYTYIPPPAGIPPNSPSIYGKMPPSGQILPSASATSASVKKPTGEVQASSAQSPTATSKITNASTKSVRFSGTPKYADASDHLDHKHPHLHVTTPSNTPPKPLPSMASSVTNAFVDQDSNITSSEEESAKGDFMARQESYGGLKLEVRRPWPSPLACESTGNNPASPSLQAQSLMELQSYKSNPGNVITNAQPSNTKKEMRRRVKSAGGESVVSTRNLEYVDPLSSTPYTTIYPPLPDWQTLRRSNTTRTRTKSSPLSPNPSSPLKPSVTPTPTSPNVGSPRKITSPTPRTVDIDDILNTPTQNLPHHDVLPPNSGNHPSDGSLGGSPSNRRRPRSLSLKTTGVWFSNVFQQYGGIGGKGKDGDVIEIRELGIDS